MQPPIKRRHRSRVVPVLLVFLALVIAGGGGAAWWLSGAPAKEMAVPAGQILPGNSAVIIQYHVASAEERSKLISLWSTTGREPASVQSLLDGDPRLLLTEADIATFYYVLLEDEMRPSVVVPQSRRSQELFTAAPAVRLEEISGWYVASDNASPSRYRAALAEGTLTQRGDNIVAQPGGPVQVFLGPHALVSLREALLGSELAQGLIQEAALVGQVQGDQSALALTGQATTVEPAFAATPTAADQQLLTAIPPEVEVLHLGSNFSHDLSRWAPLSGALDMAVLEQPAAAALLQQLTGSYAFFSLSSSPAARDIGVIITLPPAVRSQLRLPDPTVEGALSALLPLITGRKGIAPIEFNNNTHAGVPLRYANFSQPSQALDYALVDNYLVIATSRESMFILLETLTGTHTSVAASPRWQELLTVWGTLPAAPHLVLGTVAVPPLARLFSAAADTSPLFGVALEPDTASATQAAATGILVIPSQ